LDDLDLVSPPSSLLLASRRNGNHKAVSLCTLPFGFQFFFCNILVFREVGGVSHLYLQYILRCLTTVLSTAAQGTNPHFRFTLPSQFPRLSLCLTFITIASDTSYGTRRGECPLRWCHTCRLDECFNPQYIRLSMPYRGLCAALATTVHESDG